MRYMFIAKDIDERDKIQEVLDKWCVPYKLISERKECIVGYNTSYKFITDLSEKETMSYENIKISPLAFIKKKVEEALKIHPDVEHLEKCFDIPSFDPEKAREKKSRKRKNNEPNLGIDFKGIMDRVLTASGMTEPQPNRKALCDFIDMIEGMDTETRKKLARENNLAAHFDPDAIVMKYDDLPDFIKETLAKEMPIAKLKSDRCMISINPIKHSVNILFIEGE